MPIIYVGNNNLLTLSGVTNCATGVIDTSAAVTVTLKDKAGANVTGQTWPATMAHTTGGTYRATLDADLALTANREYTAFIEATGSNGAVGHWELALIAATRVE